MESLMEVRVAILYVRYRQIQFITLQWRILAHSATLYIPFYSYNAGKLILVVALNYSFMANNLLYTNI